MNFFEKLKKQNTNRPNYMQCHSYEHNAEGKATIKT